MRLALFAPYLPLPAVTGGRIRLARLAAGLRKRGEVELFATGIPSGLRDPETRALHRDAFDGVHLGIDRWAFLPGRRLPRRVARSDARALARAFARAHRAQPFDGVVVAHSHAAPVAARTGLPLVLDEHNVESRYDAEQASAAGRVAPDLDRLRAWETRVWRAARTVVAVSVADADEIRSRVPEAVVETIPNGVDAADLSFVPPSARGGAEVVFVGLMSHPPNVKAAIRLAERVMPRVWASRPDAGLTLAGHAPRPEVLALAGPRVRVTGSVPSMAPILGRARVSVSPLEHGAGTSLKVVEALASGAPLVTTAVGIRGYPAAIRDLVTVADDDDGLAAGICRALDPLDSDPAADARARAGRTFAEGYDWTRLADRFADVVEAALTRGARAPTGVAGAPASTG